MKTSLQSILDQLYWSKSKQLINLAKTKKTKRIIYVYYDSRSIFKDSIFLKSKQRLTKQFNIELIKRDLNDYSIIELVDQFNDIKTNHHFLYFEHPLSSYYKKLNLNQYLSFDIDLEAALYSDQTKHLSNYLPIAGSIVVDLVKLINLNKELKIVVIGKSTTYGLYIYNYLVNNQYDVCLFDSKTNNINTKLKAYDVVISTINQANVFSFKDLKDNSYLIDGTTVHYNNSLVGSFDINTYIANKNINYITTPNGVGKLSSIYLLLNYFKD
ncbi:hypothetical protein JM47_02625 [Ureaplasma diversum]|uniref:Tetrahydrofolate dehydrogenase/cyclohydrolase NAD(P)-binding domain-containing protein n=1 Tax=Ureaplasma diversum TaxID=42094 RepID=A0A0C5RM25_9BACT|nr:bifunctional 5,10-methylenetetrahydrofolate dehydrogenase/5,10-methenyltetrahydrofolate cyclohydrolase [Ureaplasma diversum]AJQ45452.1 hypothetical protein JM47_02625 [Ureaplasma diversum]